MMTTANSWNKRPINPPMNRTGNEHGRQRQRHGENGEGDFLAAFNAPPRIALTHFHMAHDVFQHHDGVVDHEADR